METRFMAIRKPIKPEKLGGKQLTLPGLYVKPYESLLQYSDKSIEHKVAQSYADEGLEIPDFEKMDKIERLEALSEWRGKAMDAKADIDRRNSEAQKAKQKEETEKLIKQRVSDELARQQATANGGGNSI